MTLVNQKGQGYHTINDDMLSYIPIEQGVIDKAREENLRNPIDGCIVYYYDRNNTHMDRSKMLVRVSATVITMDFGCGMYKSGEWETSPGVQQWINDFNAGKDVGPEMLILSGDTATQDANGKWIPDKGTASFQRCLGLPNDATGTYIFDYVSFRYHKVSEAIVHLEPVYVVPEPDDSNVEQLTFDF